MLKERFLRLNAALLEEWFRGFADKLHELIPDSPSVSYILFYDKGVSMASIEVLDTAAPFGASVGFVDAHGHPTTADDVPAWSSDNEAAATVAASEDGLSATVTVVAPGAAIISVNSVNTDGTTAGAQGTVTVLPGDAVLGEVTFTPAEAPPVEEPPVEEPPAEEPPVEG
jgi:hypothetical protein